MEILSSRYNYDMEFEIFSRLRNDLKNNNKVYLVVPEQFTLQNEIKLMEELQVEAISDIKIMSFQKLALEGLTQVGGLKRAYIDGTGKTMAIKGIFENLEELKLYKQVSNKPGFIESTVDLIAELKRSKIDPELLLQAGEDGKDSILFSQKVKEIAYIYQSFNTLMEGKYVDNEDRIGQLAEMDLSYLKGTKLYFFSFLSFTQSEYQVFERLIEAGVELIICLNLDLQEQEDYYSLTKGTLEKFIKIKPDAIITHLEINPELQRNKDIEFLADNVFALVPNTKELDEKQISIYVAHNIEEEVRNVALQISKKVVEDNWRYKDILVIPSDSLIYASALKQIFSEYNIPYFLDEKRAINNSPIIKSILSALNILNRGFSYEDVIVLLKNGFTKISNPDTQIFENHMLKRKLKGNMFFVDKYFQGDNHYYSPQEKEIVLRVREYIIDIFEKYKDLGQGNHSIKDMSGKIFNLMVELEIPQQVQSFVKTLRETQKIDAANENSQVWNVFLKILDQSVELLGEKEMSLKSYLDILQEGIKNYKLAVIPPTKDQVNIGDLDRSRTMEVKAVYILGMNNDLFPRQVKEKGLLTSEDKEHLEKLGIHLPSIEWEVDQNETMLIYSILTRSKEQLHMSYATDGGGKSSSPSSIIKQAKEIFPNLLEKVERNFDTSYFISTAKPTIGIMAREIYRYTNGEEIDELWLDALSYYLESKEDIKEIDNALEGIFYDNTKLSIGSEKARRLYKYPMKVSTTRIDSFIRCPFKHFIQYGIRAKERKEYRVDNAEIGSVLHLSIEEFVRKIKMEPELLKVLDKKTSDKIIGEIFDDSAKLLLPEYEESDKRTGKLLSKLKGTARLVGYNAVEQIRIGEFELLYQEAKFGENLEIPPIVLDINGEFVVLEGVIDRVDILREENNTYVKIIDYKSRDKSFSLSDAYQGLDIQLVVYLKAAMESKLLKNTKVHPAGIFYFPIFSPTIKEQERDPQVIAEKIKEKIRLDGLILDNLRVINAIEKDSSNAKGVVKTKGSSKSEHILKEEDFKLLIDKVETNLKKAIEEISQGVIEAKPILVTNTKQATCEYCRYGSICKFEQEINDSYKKISNIKNQQVLESLRGEK